MSQTNRKQIVIGVTGVIIGFILGFFGAKATENPPESTAQEGSGLPENHPSPEQLKQLQAWLEAAEADPKDRQVRVALGNAYYDMGRYDAAIPWYEEAVSLEDSDVHVSTDLGTAYLYMGNVVKAIEQYKESLKLDADHPQTLQNLGIAYFSSGKYSEAVEAWEHLLEKHPEYPNIEEIKKQIQTAKTHQSQGQADQ